MFYVVSPKDLVAAKQRDVDDHIQWLLERKRYEKALEAAQEALAWGGSKRYDVGEIGQKYLSWLIEEGMPINILLVNVLHFPTGEKAWVI